MKQTLKKRLFYLVTFILFFLIEVFIALFINDSIIRPFGGDVIVVWVIYCFVRIFVPEKLKSLPLMIFIFASLIEISQYFNLVGILGFENNRIIATMMGSSFSFIDIACYGIGCAVIEIIHIKKDSIKKLFKHK